jgi:uncharacterized protein YqeY
MALHEQLTTDLKNAMRSRDTTKVSVIRLLKSAITYEEKNKGTTLDDEGIEEIIARQAKQRRESIEQFQKGQRQDLADKELAELKELQAYLPEQMSLDDIRSIALEIISELNASGIEDKGRVMGSIMPKVKGKADGAAVNQLITTLLSSDI